MKLKRVMLAAPKSGSGKTTITCALLQALKNKGHKVVSYKCGPDYIDPMFHQKVIDIPSKNLDTFFTDEEGTREIFLKGRNGEEFAVLEGVMGVFDGLGGVREEGSSYHLAKVTQTPIILVVDAKGMGRSIIPLIAGYLAYDKEKLIQGVILNRMSKFYYATIKPLIEEELHIKVVGCLPEYKQFGIESRYLGLTLPGELEDIKTRLQALAEEFVKTVSVQDIIKIAENADEIEAVFALDEYGIANSEGNSPIIAVARDEAFCFYYEDNIRMLSECGAGVVYFSPLHDTELPAGCSGILIGGGYPELYAEKLSRNTDMLVAIKAAMQDDMPVVAECGGFMYLHLTLEDQNGISYTMVGALPERCHYTGRSVRFGYIEVEEQANNWLQGERIRGHEFHYFDSEDNGEDCLAIKPVTGKSYPCVMVGENYWLGFPHLYYPSNPGFAQSFVHKVKMYQERKGR